MASSGFRFTCHRLLVRERDEALLFSFVDFLLVPRPARSDVRSVSEDFRPGPSEPSKHVDGCICHSSVGRSSGGCGNGELHHPAGRPVFHPRRSGEPRSLDLFPAHEEVRVLPPATRGGRPVQTAGHDFSRHPVLLHLAFRRGNANSRAAPHHSVHPGGRGARLAHVGDDSRHIYRRCIFGLWIPDHATDRDFPLFPHIFHSDRSDRRHRPQRV